MEESFPRIKDIPLEDIEITLLKNGISDVKNPYESIKKLIFSGKLNSSSAAIINWILAYNAKMQHIVGIYNISQIIRASDDELRELSNSLGLREPDKDDIVQILSYLNKLKDDFELLPDELLIKIMAELRYDDLVLLNEASKAVNKLYHSSEFSDILQQKIKDKINAQYTWRFEGMIDIDEIFNVRDKVSQNYISNYRRCEELNHETLMDIMWSIGVKIPVNNHVLNKKFLISKLSELFGVEKKRGRPKRTCRTPVNSKRCIATRFTYRILPKNDISEWDLNKLNYYNDILGLDKSEMCTMIQTRMEELETLNYQL
jgi:hypothetical protein